MRTIKYIKEANASQREDMELSVNAYRQFPNLPVDMWWCHKTESPKSHGLGNWNKCTPSQNGYITADYKFPAIGLQVIEDLIDSLDSGRERCELLDFWWNLSTRLKGASHDSN